MSRVWRPEQVKQVLMCRSEVEHDRPLASVGRRT